MIEIGDKMKKLQAIKFGTPSRKTGNSYLLLNRLVRESGLTYLSEFFTQHLKHIDVSTVKISCNFVEWLTRYKQKKKGTVFFESPCT